MIDQRDVDIRPGSVVFPESVKIGESFTVEGPKCGDRLAVYYGIRADEGVAFIRSESSGYFEVPEDGWHFESLPVDEALVVDSELTVMVVCDARDYTVMNAERTVPAVR